MKITKYTYASSETVQQILADGKPGETKKQGRMEPVQAEFQSLEEAVRHFLKRMDYQESRDGKLCFSTGENGMVCVFFQRREEADLVHEYAAIFFKVVTQVETEDVTLEELEACKITF